MRVEQWRIFIVSAVIFLGSIVVMPFLQEFIPSQEMGFISIGLLNEDEFAQNYFPLGQIIGQDIKWNIIVSNHMEYLEHFSLRVRLLNSTQLSPNSTTCSPSSGKLIYEKRIIVQNGDEILIPFSWNAINVTFNEQYYIHSMLVNEKERQIDVIDESGRFKLVFELWRYDLEKDYFVFKWSIDDRERCSWAQINIDLT